MIWFDMTCPHLLTKDIYLVKVGYLNIFDCEEIGQKYVKMELLSVA